MTHATANAKMTRRRAVWAATMVAVLLFVACAGWYLTSPQFNDWTRQRLISRLESMTGGRVEIGSFQWHLSRLELDVSNITIHGLEGPGEIPYAHADRLLIRAKILSLVGREIGLRWVQMDRPVVHIIVYPDGHTNQPTPKAVIKSSTTPVQRLFELAINHAEINQGQFILNEKRMPIDLAADELKAQMDYVPATQHYHGMIKFGAVRAKYSKRLAANGNGELNFDLARNALEIQSFRVVSGHSELAGSGKVSNFSQPVVEVAYRGRLDTREVAQITNSPELRAGVVEANGVARWVNRQLTSDGKLLLREGEYRTPSVRIRNVDATANYSLDEKKLTLSQFGARVFGGLVRGDITIENWMAPPASAGEPNATEPSGIAHLRVSNLPLGIVAEGFSDKRIDWGRLNLAGTAEGTIVAHWRGTPKRAVAELNLAAVPPSHPRAGQLPLTAELQGTYDAGTGRVRAHLLHLAIPDTSINAAGVFGSATEQVHLSVVANDLSRLQPLLAALHDQDSDLGRLTGKLKFDGTLAGALRKPAVEGNVEVSDFDFPLAMVMSSSPPPNAPKRLHLDSGEANIAFNQQGLIVRGASLRHAGSQMSFDVSAGLSGGFLTDSSPIRAHFVLRNADVSELQQMAGYSYPVTGVISAAMNVRGTKASPAFGGHLQLKSGSIWGEPVQAVTADLQYGQQQLHVNNLQAIHNGAQIKASGNYNRNTTAFNFQAVGNNFQLANIRKLQNNRVLLAGVLSFSATGSGTRSKPIVNASARLHNLVVNGERVGDATLMAVTQGDRLKISARSNFQTTALSMDGSVKLQDPRFPANIAVRFTDFDFMPYLPSVLQGVNAKSDSAGTLLVQGPLRDPKELTVKAEIPDLTAEMQGVQLRNSEPIQLSMMNGVVRVDSFKMVGPDTQMDVRGIVRVTEDMRIRLLAQGRMNLKLAQSFSPDLNSSGYADFDVSIGGNVTKPRLQGQVRIANGAFSLIDFPNGLSNVNGSLVFTEDRVQVQSLTAHTGGGDVEIGGFATYGPQLMFNLTAQGQDIRLRYPQGISSTANIDLKLMGTMADSTLSGDVTITRFGFNSQFDLAVYLARSNRPMAGPSSSVLNNLHFNVHVMSTPELQVQSSLAKLAGNVDVRLRGSGANPVLLGRVNVTEGQFSFNGQTYRLQRGDVTFNNPTRTEPNIDVEATTRVRDYDLTLGFHGQLSHGLNTNYRSDPPLPQADIINLLAFGRTREEAEMASQTGSSAYTGVVSSAILGQALNTAVGDRVQKLFGVSRVKISPEVGTTQTNPTAQVTIEQQVSNKVTITYITSVSQSSQQSIFVEYNVNPQLSVIAGRDQYGVVSFDVRIRQRKR